MNGVWGDSSSDTVQGPALDVFVFGSTPNGMILHYDGRAWSSMPSSTYHWLCSGWGSSGSDVFAVGEGGTILHYDGSVWAPMKSGTSRTLINVRGTSGTPSGAVSRSDIFIAGENATILHYDGEAWSVMNDKWPVQPAPTHAYRDGMGTNPYLEGVWAASPTDAFAVGDFGMIMHYDGKAWSTMVSGVNVDLPDVFGTSGSDVFAVGDMGTILHYDGKAWSTMVSGGSGRSKSINTLWRTPGGDLFAVGDRGTILRYDGKAWSPMQSGTTSNLTGVWGSNNDLYAVGHDPVSVILHYDGKAWFTVSVAPY
jgi:photosystem II stability/assembly factor-like uncharacterized protein